MRHHHCIFHSTLSATTFTSFFRFELPWLSVVLRTSTSPKPLAPFSKGMWITAASDSMQNGKHLADHPSQSFGFWASFHHPFLRSCPKLKILCVRECRPACKKHSDRPSQFRFVAMTFWSRSIQLTSLELQLCLAWRLPEIMLAKPGF